MMERMGFVSNSSSSSFIICVPPYASPLTYRSVKQCLGDINARKKVESVTNVTYADVYRRIYNDLMRTPPIRTSEQLDDIVSYGRMAPLIGFNSLAHDMFLLHDNTREHMSILNSIRELDMAVQDNLLRAIKSKIGTTYRVYSVTYGDESGSLEAACENGYHWNKARVCVLQINCH